MIPVRVMVRGFLSYKDQAELTFDSAKLWMLWGRNGAGKSAIFDAITFVLFGSGRFGEKAVKEYIHHECKDMDVEFDFDLDDKRYRVKRTAAQKGSSSYQAFTLDRANTALPPAPIADTNTETSLKNWVTRTLNLDSNTFVAAAMLRQGDSDRLLSPKDGDRAPVMSRIVDMSPYEKLHGVTNELAKQLEDEAKRLQTTLTQSQVAIKTGTEQAITLCGLKASDFPLQDNWIASVNDLIRRLADIQGNANTEAQKLQTLIEAMNRILATLQGWKSKQVQRATLSSQKAAYAMILQDAVAIERRAARLQELTGTIPARNAWNAARGDWRAAKQQSKSATTEIARLKDLLEDLDGQRTAAEKALDQIRQRYTDAVGALGSANTELKTLHKRRNDLAHTAGDALCEICGKLLTEEQRQEQLGLLNQAITVAAENVAVAETNQKSTRAHVDSADYEVKRLTEEIKSATDKVNAAERARDLGRQAMQNEEQKATRVLEDLDRCFHACGMLTVNDAPYTPENIHARLLNDGSIAVALETGSYPTAEEMQTAQEERHHLKGADTDKQELDRARKEAGDIDAKISAYTMELQQDEARIATDGEILGTSDKHDLLEALESAQQGIEAEICALADIGGVTDPILRQQLATEAIKRIENAAGKPGIWAGNQIDLSTQARSAAAGREKNARDYHQSLKGKIDEHGQKEYEWRKTTRQANIYRTLERKLDKKGLQSWLRVAAEQSIVANADHILQRLSNNMLTMKLADNEKGESLDLRITDHEKGARDLRPPALSGSQKFRVSVALALGIGQYACGQSQGGIKSVIIDEGFGSLDKEGRDQMITELQNLGKVLERIIVVSHQEEFQTAFANRWHIYVEDGTAKAALVI